MESTVLHSALDGAAAFWLFLAAIIVAGTWEKSRREAQRHETLRRIMEKTGTIDEARLQELFKGAPVHHSQWHATSPPGYAYRGLRACGTIIMFIAGGVATFFVILGVAGLAIAKEPAAPLIIAAAVGVIGGSVGAGLFYAARFTQRPPPGPGDEPPAR